MQQTDSCHARLSYFLILKHIIHVTQNSRILCFLFWNNSRALDIPKGSLLIQKRLLGVIKLTVIVVFAKTHCWHRAKRRSLLLPAELGSPPLWELYELHVVHCHSMLSSLHIHTTTIPGHHWVGSFTLLDSHFVQFHLHLLFQRYCNISGVYRQ